MTIADAVMVFAVLAGPLLAGLMLRWLQLDREQRQRKEWIFKTLMATRAAKLSAEHVQALNLIDIEFSKKGKEKAVVEAWKEYFDHLCTPVPKEAGGHPAFVEVRENRFVELLYKMGQALRFDFDRVTIRRQGYGTQHQEDLELAQQALIRGLLDVLYQKRSLPVLVTELAQQSYAVRCPKCGFQNIPSAINCGQCNAPLPKTPEAQ